MPSAIIYHNPRCSKSRKTLELLEQQDIPVTIVKYLETPPDEEVLEKIINMLGVKADDLMRKNEEEYKAHFKSKSLTEDEKISLMVQYPKVIERPIVVRGNHAVIGRPPENVLKLF